MNDVDNDDNYKYTDFLHFNLNWLFYLKKMSHSLRTVKRPRLMSTSEPVRKMRIAGWSCRKGLMMSGVAMAAMPEAKEYTALTELVSLKCSLMKALMLGMQAE